MVDAMVKIRDFSVIVRRESSDGSIILHLLFGENVLNSRGFQAPENAPTSIVRRESSDGSIILHLLVGENVLNSRGFQAPENVIDTQFMDVILFYSSRFTSHASRNFTHNSQLILRLSSVQAIHIA